MDDVISPVPMNPSCMSLSCRFQAVTRTVLERSPTEQTIFFGIPSDERSGLTLGKLPANIPSPDYGRLAVIRPESRAQKVFAQTTAALTANPQVKLIGIINRCRLNTTFVVKNASMSLIDCASGCLTCCFRNRRPMVCSVLGVFEL